MKLNKKKSLKGYYQENENIVGLLLWTKKRFTSSTTAFGSFVFVRLMFITPVSITLLLRPSGFKAVDSGRKHITPT